MPLDAGTIKQFIAAFKKSEKPLIDNVATELELTIIDNEAFLTSINSQSKQRPVNSYVVSPVTAFGHYALDEIRRLHRPWVTWPLKLLVLSCRSLFVSGRLDSVVNINNWLLSTNIYPATWQGDGGLAAVKTMAGNHPDKAITFRSLNTHANSSLLANLLKQGFIGVPSRQVYIFDFRKDASVLHQRHNNRMDAKLLAKMPFKRCQAASFSEGDFKRAEYLYRDLYVNKYSELNPQYTAEWLKLGALQGWLELEGLRNEQGELDGVVGWVVASDTVTAPIVGYDTSKPAKLGLYRLLTHLCLLRAANENKRLNFSSGAAHFKRLRGGEPAIEYSAIYIAHLPFWPRFVWRLLSFLLTKIAVPLMQRWQL
mgnify:CR=1 FL=1